jgi:uncharacterized protein (TIRG00374 family)
MTCSGSGTQSRGWRQHKWREWRSRLRKAARPLRYGITVAAVLLVAKYLVVPQLSGAGRGLYLLTRVNVGWLAGGLALEGTSLLCYGLLTKALLPSGGPGWSRLLRIDLAAAAVAHVIPAGGVSGTRVGYRLFRAEGIKGSDAAVMMAAQGFGSAVVLNVLLWISLIASLPVGGFHLVYGTVLVASGVIIVALAAIAAGILRGHGGTSRVLRIVGELAPGLSGDGLERGVRNARGSLAVIGRDHRVLARSLVWASLNWLLDATSLWCFVAAFGFFANPVELFAAYGIANLAAGLPLTPAGLGVIESLAPLLLISSGVTRSVAILGVLAWRMVNFWLPIPAGAVAYVSLKIRATRTDGDAPAIPAAICNHSSGSLNDEN